MVIDDVTRLSIYNVMHMWGSKYDQLRVGDGCIAFLFDRLRHPSQLERLLDVAPAVPGRAGICGSMPPW